MKQYNSAHNGGGCLALKPKCWNIGWVSSKLLSFKIKYAFQWMLLMKLWTLSMNFNRYDDVEENAFQRSVEISFLRSF